MKRRAIDPTPFDRKREPPRQNLFIMPALWLWSWLSTGRESYAFENSI